MMGSDNIVFEIVDGEENCQEVDIMEKLSEEIEEIKGEEEQSEIVVDMLSVVRVREQVQYLEGIICVI